MDEPDLDIPPYASQHLRARRVDPTTKRIALIAALLAAVVIVVALVWSGVHTGFGPPPVIKPPPGPMRTIPANPGGLQVPGANEQIMSGAQSNAPPALAPPASAPDLSKLQREIAHRKALAEARDQAAKRSLHPIPAVRAPAMAGQSSLGQSSVGQSSLPLPPPAAPTALPPLPLPPASSGASSVANGVASSATGGPMAQLAALNSAAAANQAWETLNARMPNLLAGRTPVIQTATVKGRKFWRLRVAGFANAPAAKKFCATVKSEGAACEVAGP